MTNSASSHEPFDPHELDFLDDVRSLESPSQQILRKEFEDTETRNRTALDDFDPRVPDARAEIELTTSFPEAEAAEPQLAASKQQTMLRGLGLLYQPLESAHPDRIFEHRYRDGEVDQIRLLTREDGEQIPVFTTLGSNEDGNPIERIRLLSYDKAEELATRLENGLDEYKLDVRLADEFGLDRQMLELADLSFEDKRSMLAAFDEIQDLEVAKPDTAVLDRVRKNLVKSMLPGTKFMSFVREKRFAKAQDAYMRSVSGLAEQYGLDEKFTRELVQSEQLCRLQALNEQLRFRHRAAKVGAVAMTSLVTLVGAGSGAGVAMMAEVYMNESTPIGKGIGGLVGGGAGLLLGMEQVMDLRKRTRHISGFSTDRFYRDDRLDSQLREEQRLAEVYITLLGK